MPTDSIWTALPTGRTGPILRLSVHVSPRLTVPGGGQDTLASFPAFASWPPGDLGFDVVVGATTYPSRVVTIVSSPDPSLWPKLFPGTSGVRSHEVPDRSQTPIHTYPLAKIVAFLRERWSESAIQSPEVFPAIVDLLAAGFEDIRFSGRTGRERFEQAKAQLAAVLGGPDKVVDTRASSTTTFDFIQFDDFFAPLDPGDPAVRAAYDEPAPSPELDFHDAVQFVNQHPPLMRLLGLAFDLDVDTSVSPVATGPAVVSVVPASSALDGTTVRTPGTQADVGASSFAATPRPGSTHLVPGWLRFEDTGEFETVLVEADGGAFKAVDFAGNLGRRQEHPTSDTPTEAALPTLRADGIAVARPGKAAATRGELLAAAAKEADLATNALVLHLDDIVRGYRVDVWDSRSGAWHSLMERTGQYELDGGATVLAVADEGFIGSTATKKLLSDDLYLSEEVCWWDGWSLVVPRPGRTLTTDSTDPNPLIERPPNSPGPDFDARFHFDVLPGSLPRLRYGVDYRLRARLVDLAGNSLPAGVADDTHATPPVTFGRFEPPQTPPVLLRTAKGPGESVETVVLRSDFDAAPAPGTAQRHVTPAKVGQLTIERHGEIDNPNPDAGAYALLAARDDATLLNHPAIDAGTGDRDRYYDVDDLEVTWAPDPLVRRFALKFLDGAHAGLILQPEVGGAGWPGFESIRIVVSEGSGTPSFDPVSNVLTVPLGKAEVVRARLSGVIDPGELPELGLWHWVLAALPGGAAGEQARAELEAVVARGQHWMFEPFRVLTLVHAVRRPLATPEFPSLPVALRAQAATFAEITGPLDFDRRSTSRIDVLASWQEPVDAGPGAAAPADVGTQGAVVVDRQTAFVVDIEQGEHLHPTRLNLRERHELGDTKHRVITYRGVATSRFSEFFTTSDSFTFDGPGSMVVLDTGVPAEGVVPGSVKLSYPDGDARIPLTEGEGRDYTVDPSSGTVTFGSASSLPAVGTSIHAVYLVPPVSRETADPAVAKGQHGAQVVSVPSSARPQAPKVRYVIPTFGWSDGELLDGGEVIGLTSQRLGNGIRVYLERPWWTSGEGELLGVITWPPGEASEPPDLETSRVQDVDARGPYVTQWGQDPIYGSRLLPARYPRISSFPGRVGSGTALTLAELEGAPDLAVNIVGHTVGFDGDRDLWYCDIAVDPGPAYSPFVRLALARWQPESITDAELSKVALADFVQLAPDRFASVAFDDADDSVMTVNLTGPTHVSTEASDGNDPGSALVIVEERVSDFDGELAWTQVGLPIEMTGALFNGVGQWFAEVHLPGPRNPGRWRLIIEQFELLGTEPESKDPLANPFIRTTPVPVPRLVHTDIIPI